jgi:hypothetical protein
MFARSAVRIPHMVALAAKRASSSSKPAITLYGFPLSQPTRAVLMLLKANDIPFNFHVVNAMKVRIKKTGFTSGLYSYYGLLIGRVENSRLSKGLPYGHGTVLGR